MTRSPFRVSTAGLLACAGLALSACGGTLPSLSGSSPPPEPPPAQPLPASLRPEEIVGRWGLAAYHRPEDRARTEAQARSGCSQPYVINRSSTGVSMLGHDNPAVQDMLIKGSPEGKTYIGPGNEYAGPDDREVVSYDGRVLILKWVDPEVAGRYGFMVLVRCGAEGTARGTRPARAPGRPAQ